MPAFIARVNTNPSVNTCNAPVTSSRNAPDSAAKPPNSQTTSSAMPR